MKKIKESIVHLCRFLKILYIKMKDIKKKKKKNGEIFKLLDTFPTKLRILEFRKFLRPLHFKASECEVLSNKNCTFQNSKFMIGYFHLT